MVDRHNQGYKLAPNFYPPRHHLCRYKLVAHLQKCVGNLGLLLVQMTIPKIDIATLLVCLQATSLMQAWLLGNYYQQ